MKIKRIILVSFVILFLSVPQLFAALVIEGEMESLNPISKSMRVIHTTKEGKKEKVDITVPDGTPFVSPAHSLTVLRVGDPVAVTVKIGSKPGEWVATEIKHLVDIKTLTARRPPVDPAIKKKADKRLEEMIAGLEKPIKKNKKTKND